MTHDLFGKLKYRPTDGCWVASVPLPAFAGYGAKAAQPPPTEEEAGRLLADMNQALDALRGQMRERFGTKIDDAFADIDADTERQLRELDEEGPDPDAEGREERRQERARKKAERLAAGRYPVRVADPDGTGPRPEQEAAFRHLAANEPAVLAAVLGQVWESFRGAYADEHWRKIAGIPPAASPAELRGRFGLSRLEIPREHRGGLAHLVFNVDSGWQDEHGLVVVYSPDTGAAAWASRDTLPDLLETDEADDGAAYVATPHDELVEAVLNGDDARARELVAAGADINALAADEYPPLCMAVDQVEVDEVRRLLAYGADPNLPDPQEKKTPLKMARRTFKEMGFGPTKKKDAFLDAMMTLAREAAGKQFDEMKTRLEEIIRLLEAAGGK